MTMKNEHVFNAGGFYSFVVRSDALLHSGAVTVGRKVIGESLLTWPKEKPVRILDLACGSLPVSISDIMAAFGDYNFEYTGVDINPDQVRLARQEFEFPKNVGAVTIMEGNAWDLDSLGLFGKFDIVFSGLNFHHAVPEELYFLAWQLQKYLSPDGIIFNHDLYRPHHQAYLKRPKVNPHSPDENLALLSDLVLSQIKMPDFGIVGQDYIVGKSNWRDDFLSKLNSYLLLKGATPENIEVNTPHILGHDFSVSTNELQMIFGRAGFTVQTHDYAQPKHPVSQYIAFVSARRR